MGPGKTASEAKSRAVREAEEVLKRARAMEPQYREFYGPLEFKPYRNKWIRHKDQPRGTGFRVNKILAEGVIVDGGIMTWIHLLQHFVFDENSKPVGIEIRDA